MGGTIMKLRTNKPQAFLLLGDMLSMGVAIVLSFYFSAFLSNYIFGREYNIGATDIAARLSSFFGTACVLFLIFLNRGHYIKRMSWWQQVQEILFVCFIGLLLDTFFNFSTKTTVSRFWVFNSWVFFFFLILLFRQFIKIILCNLGSWNQGVVVIGESEEVMNTVFAILSDSYMGYSIKKIIITDSLLCDTDRKILFGTFIDVEIKIVRSTQEIFLENLCGLTILAFSDFGYRFTKIAEALEAKGNKYVVSASLGVIPLYGSESRFYFGYDLMMIKPKCNMASPLVRMVKRGIDFIAALLGLIVLSPVFFVVTLFIRLDGGNVFYGHKRVGLGGKEFKCWKFRSMKTNSKEILARLLKEDEGIRKEWEISFKIKNDPRITRIGKFLRKTSLDELPQLWNVLKGDMSLVGPRPVVQDELEYYEGYEGYYLAVRPGLTGVWQVNGRSDTTYKQRVKFDVWYANNWSIWNDIVILCKTVKIVLLGKGAC